MSFVLHINLSSVAAAQWQMHFSLSLTSFVARLRLFWPKCVTTQAE